MPDEKNRNVQHLLAEGDIASRKIVLEIADRTLQRLDAYGRMRGIMALDGDVLTIGERRWDLSKKRHVYLFGAGKACNHMAMAVDHVLGDRLTKGIAIVKIHEQTDRFDRTEVVVGGHPLPNQAGFEASRRMIEIVDQSTPDDLFICVISGGSSALMSCPVDGISLQDEIDTTNVLLKSGAGIYEINAVRRQISALNGGMLAKRIQDRGAELIGFGISDAVGALRQATSASPTPPIRAPPLAPMPRRWTTPAQPSSTTTWQIACRSPWSIT